MQKITKANDKVKYYISLHFLLLLSSFTGVFSKMAAKQDFLSIKFCLFYLIMLFLLFVYAIAWQQIIRHLPLTTAFCNKAVSIVWGILWGVSIFKETIKWNMIAGAIVVIFGVIMVVKADE